MTELLALIVEDDEDLRASVAMLVEREGFLTRQADSLAAARREIEEQAPDVVLLDLVLPDGEGLELLSDEELARDTEFVVMTGHVAVESAVAALRKGALDYLSKPVDRARLKTVLMNVARTRGLRRDVSSLRDELRGLGRFGEMVGRSAPMQQVYDLISRVAPTQSSVFVTGESGTGKELVAQTVHNLSKRRDHPFVALNCGAVSASLIESELFGHEKGSFTGADSRRQGYFEVANGGTLFLDEITEMPIELQVKLLRALEAGEVVRLGATTPVDVDVRVVSASNRDPAEAIEEGKLREDLFYRLNVFPIALPPLRERGPDVLQLGEHFLNQINAREGSAKRMTEEAQRRLSELPWPGNVRELKNMIERVAILADDEIGAELFSDAPTHEPSAGPALEVGRTIADVERNLILATLDDLDGDKKKAAEVLGISLKTLYNRLNLYEAEGI